MSAAEEYYTQTMELLQRLRDTQMDAIDRARGNLHREHLPTAAWSFSLARGTRA